MELPCPAPAAEEPRAILARNRAEWHNPVTTAKGRGNDASLRSAADRGAGGPGPERLVRPQERPTDGPPAGPLDEPDPAAERGQHQAHHHQPPERADPRTVYRDHRGPMAPSDDAREPRLHRGLVPQDQEAAPGAEAPGQRDDLRGSPGHRRGPGMAAAGRHREDDALPCSPRGPVTGSAGGRLSPSPRSRA